MIGHNLLDLEILSWLSTLCHHIDGTTYFKGRYPCLVLGWTPLSEILVLVVFYPLNLGTSVFVDKSCMNKKSFDLTSCMVMHCCNESLRGNPEHLRISRGISGFGGSVYHSTLTSRRSVSFMSCLVKRTC